MVERHETWTRRDVLSLLDLDEDFLSSLERRSIIDHSGDTYEPVVVERIRVCRTLRYDLGVNLEGIEVALTLLDRIDRERHQFAEALRRVLGRAG